MNWFIPSPWRPQSLFWVLGRDVETGLFVLLEPPASALDQVRHGLALMTKDLQSLKEAGVFAEPTPYGADSHTRRAADYFDRHFGRSYLELSSAGVTARLAEAVADLTLDVCRGDKPVTGEDWRHQLQALGKVLLQAWLVIMAEETPIFLRPIVNSTEFQHRHLAHVAQSIAIKIEFLAPLVPSPVASSAPDRTAGGGLASTAATAERSPGDLPPSAVELAVRSSSHISDPVAADVPSIAEIRRNYVIPRRDAKGWRTNEDWAQAIKKQHPDQPISARTLYNYLFGKTNPNHTTRWLMADALGVQESDLPL